MKVANVVSDPMESVIDYECPECGEVVSLEPDAGKITCEGCGEKLMCDVMYGLSAECLGFIQEVP